MYLISRFHSNRENHENFMLAKYTRFTVPFAGPGNMISTGMDNHLQDLVAFALFQYLINHPGQLSLAIPPWVGRISTGDGMTTTREKTVSSA